MPEGRRFGYINTAFPRTTGATGGSITAGGVDFIAPAQQITVKTEATAGAVTYTADEVLGGLVIRDCSGAARTDILPNAATLVAAFNGAAINTGFRLVVKNNSTAPEILTLSVGATGTALTAFAGDVLTVVAGETAEFLILFTDVAPGSEAATLYTIEHDTVTQATPVTQAGDINQPVISNGVAGRITTVSAGTAAHDDDEFTVTNASVLSTSIVHATVLSYGGSINSLPIATVNTVANGSFVMVLNNAGSAALDQLVIIGYTVV